MKKISFLIILCFLTAKLTAQHKLEKLWETDTTLTTPESVLYNAKSKMLYVSNIGDFQKPDSGSISIVDLNGKIIKAGWVTGLTATKGLGLYKGLLYAAEQTTVAVIDINLGTIVKRIAIEGAQFLNDITIDNDGIVYVSDTRANKVYKIENEQASIYLENMKSANGVLSVGADLYVLTNGSLQKLDKTKKATTIATGMDSSTDGIEKIGANEFIVSCWSGVIYHVKPNGSTELLLDTRDKKINSADIGYNRDAQIIYVPTFAKNSVVAYRLK